jgi:RND family efflux transporter MFP subunit
LGTKIMGRVETLPHEEGDEVEAGEVLLTLDRVELDAELAAAQASLALAQTEMEHKNTLAMRMRRLARTKSVSKDMLDDAVFGYAAARDRVVIAEAAIAKVEAMLKETRIKAPFSGIITAKEAEVGQLTQPGDRLFVVEDHSRLKFETRIKEQELRYIMIGQTVHIIFDALGGIRLKGKVSKVIPSGDPITHAFKVEILLPAQEGLYPGMFGKADFSP